MDVYVESNFVLELVFLQEEHEAAGDLMSIAEAGKIELASPTFSFAEPLSTIRRRGKQRVELANALTAELDQLRRSADLRESVAEAGSVTVLLAELEEAQLQRLEDVVLRIAASARLLPLSEAVLADAFRLRREIDLRLADAYVVSAILNDRPGRSKGACFVTRDRQHLAAPHIRERFNAVNCAVIPTLSDGVGFVTARI